MAITSNSLIVRADKKILDPPAPDITASFIDWTPRYPILTSMVDDSPILSLEDVSLYVIQFGETVNVEGHPLGSFKVTFAWRHTTHKWGTDVTDPLRFQVRIRNRADTIINAPDLHLHIAPLDHDVSRTAWSTEWTFTYQLGEEILHAEIDFDEASWHQLG
jgi:hypothetical protein